MPTVGIVFCLVFIFMGYYGNRVFSALNNILFEIRGAHPKSMEDRLPHLKGDPEKYSQVTKLLAENRFLKDGTITEYTTPVGQVVPYEPNEEIQELYQEIKRTTHWFGNTQKGFRRSMYIWITIALSSLILGVITPIRKERIKKTG